MAIDPLMYNKYNKRDVDVGATLAQASARQSARDSAPKGVGGGLRFSLLTSQLGLLGGLFQWLRTFGKFSRRDQN